MGGKPYPRCDVTLVKGTRTEAPPIELVPVGTILIHLKGIRTDTELVVRHIATDFALRRKLPPPRIRTTTTSEHRFEVPAGLTRVSLERGGHEVAAQIVDVGRTSTPRGSRVTATLELRPR